MPITLVTSAGGSPGATTTALGLALTWPGAVLLTDADPHPMQSVLAGYLRGAPAGGRGLAGLAQEYRSGAERVSPHDQAIALEADDHRRRFLPGFTHPGQARLFEPFWDRLVRGFDDFDGDVIVDCGRLGPEGLPSPLLAAARHLLLVSRSSLAQVGVTKVFWDELSTETTRHGTLAGLVVVGAGHPYSAAEISKHLKIPLLGELPLDTAVAQVLSDGASQPRKMTDRPLWRGYRALTTRLCPAAGVSTPARRARSLPEDPADPGRPLPVTSHRGLPGVGAHQGFRNTAQGNAGDRMAGASR